MTLQELLDEIKRLNRLKENREHCTIDMQLRVIKMVVESVNTPVQGWCRGTPLLEIWEHINDELNSVLEPKKKEE